MNTAEKAAAIRAALDQRPDPSLTAAILLAKITSPRKDEREQAKRHIRELAQIPRRLDGIDGKRLD